MKFDDYLAEELPFKAWLDYYLDPSEVETVFEVGACEAEDTIKLSRTYPMASIYAFEPLPKNVPIAKDHIKKYGAERIKLSELALGDKTGEANFFVSSGQPPGAKDPQWDYGNKSSSLLKPDKTTSVHKWLKFNEEIRVKTERLDSFCQRNGIGDIDFLYLDVQGAELMVLKGASKALRDIKAVWLEVEAVELYKDQPLKNRVEQFMEKAGFSRVMDTVGKVSGDQLYIRSDLVAKVERDKSAQPKKRLKTAEKILKYTNDVWAKPYLSANQRTLLSKHIEWLNLEWNELQDKLSGKPSLSVVMDVFNGGEHLTAAIKSILGQTFKDFEFIIIDNGSTDNSIKAMRAFKDARIRIIPQTNHDLAYSLNKGVRIARSSVIARMDAGDISMPDRFKKQFSQLKKDPRIGVIGSFARRIDGSSATDEVIASPTKPIDLRRALYYIVSHIPHGGSMYRREAFDKVGGYRDDYAPVEDYDLWRRMAEEGWDLAQIPEVLYQYSLGAQATFPETQESQHHLTAKIIQEQWRKPFVNKNFFRILSDGRYYRTLKTRRAKTIYDQYVDEQRDIATELLARGRFGTGVKTALAAICLDTRIFYKLSRPLVGGLLRATGLRERKK